MKVLVAEDDRYTREGLVEVLEAEGYRVIPAVDGTDAIRLFREQSPDFVCQHISQLRKRVEPDPGNPTLIKTVHGVGYRYDPAMD